MKRMEQSIVIECPECKTLQGETILDLTYEHEENIGDIPIICSSCECDFTVVFTFVPYISTYLN